MNNFYKKLSDERLWEDTKKLVRKERELSLQVIHHLEEIESRKLYLKRGFSSLFHYCVKELQYSEKSAYLRIKTMKLCKEVPEVSSKIESGKLNLSNAGKLQSFFEKKRRSASSTAPRTSDVKDSPAIPHVDPSPLPLIREGGIGGIGGIGRQKTGRSASSTAPRAFGLQDSPAIPHEASLRNASALSRNSASPLSTLTPQPPFPILGKGGLQFSSSKDKLNLIEEAQGKSSRETEKLLASVDPEIAAPKEKVRELGQGKTEIKIILDQEGMKNLETLKHLLSHKNPNLSYGELVLFLSKLGLKKYDLRQKPLKKSPAQALMRQPLQKPKTLMTRYIPMNIRRKVWQRDQGCCSYKDFKSNRRCGSKHLLQVDHIQPFALGGKHEPKNLRLLCANHNRNRSQQTFNFQP